MGRTSPEKEKEMSRENLNNGLVKIEVSQEELENSISGLEQLLPVIERLVVKGSYFSGQGKKKQGKK